jgi:transposase-like protein
MGAGLHGRRGTIAGSPADDERRACQRIVQLPPTRHARGATTNVLERMNEEFRRRTKTQAMLPSEDAVLLHERSPSISVAPPAQRPTRRDVWRGRG